MAKGSEGVLEFGKKVLENDPKSLKLTRQVYIQPGKNLSANNKHHFEPEIGCKIMSLCTHCCGAFISLNCLVSV